MNDNAKAMLALFAGLAAGAAIGLLMAPEKGSETRNKISDALNEIGDELKSKVNEGINTAKEAVEKAKSKSNNLAEKGSHAASEIV